jgi:hypothetical protein
MSTQVRNAGKLLTVVNTTKEAKMAVMQEMAEIYPPEVDELCDYLPDIDCKNAVMNLA